MIRKVLYVNRFVMVIVLMLYLMKVKFFCLYEVMVFGGWIESFVIVMVSFGVIIIVVIRSWDFGLMNEGVFILLKMCVILFVCINREV